jgi:hypothetical protein
MKTLRDHIGPPALPAVFLVVTFLLAGGVLAWSAPTPPPGATVSAAGSNAIDRFISDLYNHHRLLFSVLVTVSMAVVGLGISWLIEQAVPSTGRRPRR